MIPLRWVEIDRSLYPTAVPGGNRMPLERATILAMLDDDTLYFPSNAAEVGYAKSTPEYVRTRKAFAYFGAERGLTHEYDNLDKLSTEPGAWYGSSWKWALGSGMQRVADLMDELKRHQDARPAAHFWLDGETIIEGPYPDRFFDAAPHLLDKTLPQTPETEPQDGFQNDEVPAGVEIESYGVAAIAPEPTRRNRHKWTYALLTVGLVSALLVTWKVVQDRQPPVVQYVQARESKMFTYQEFISLAQ